MSQHTGEAERESSGSRAAKPVHKSKSLIAAVVVTLIGGAMWAYAAATAPAAGAAGPKQAAPASGQHGGAGGASSLASGLAPSGGGAAPAADTEGKPAETRLIDDSAPATFRFGASFVGGFLIAWVFRKFIKTLAIVTGLAIAGVLVAKHYGVFNFDWNAAEQHVHEGVEWAESKAGTAKAFLTGYLPSSASAVTGMFFGARRG